MGYRVSCEWADALLLYLDLLKPLLADSDGGVRGSAGEALGSGLNAALKLPSKLFEQWTRSRLDTARQWLDDERPSIREWAGGLVSSLEEQLKSSEVREAEERFR